MKKAQKAKPEGADVPYDVEDDLEPQAAATPRDPEADSTLTVKLSAALVAKLKHSAQDEGISVDALVSELLAEGVALRAWEIIERKHAMRGEQQGAPQSGGFRGNGNGNGNYGNNGNHNRGPKQGGGHHGNRRGPPGAGGNAWMEDRAAFLEYVRNQEKRRR